MILGGRLFIDVVGIPTVKIYSYPYAQTVQVELVGEIFLIVIYTWVVIQNFKYPTELALWIISLFSWQGLSLILTDTKIIR